MKFLIYLSALVLILAIFTTIEAKRSSTKRPFFRKKQPMRAQMSSGRSSSFGSSMGSSSMSMGSSFGRSSFGGSSMNTKRSSLSARDTPANSEQLKKKVAIKDAEKPVNPKMSIDRSVVPKGVTYGPRGGAPGIVSGTRYIGGPRPRAYGYYTGRFPIWLTSYAVVMRTLEECPPTNEALEFAQKSFGVCMMICDKAHCIQTANYCCYYVEPQKYMRVAAK